ncbi:MAG: Hsp20/alpha crystallin family protein [Desulfamplus sp.]|nr:Hsp20/alpha crystallin family protein [Desulfamplus sp.]MBF0241053.1 Hsp20/alpha crystallin family protein [Desulfamplus sp.]
MSETKELQVKEKQEVAAPAEHTTAGLIFTPAVDIYENDNEIIMLADMPGVNTDDITIDLKDGVLTLTGDVKPWENEDESDVLVEFEIGKYYRQFTLSEAIHQEKIEAKFNDGVLKLTLPKVAKAIPRKITVSN